MNRVPSLLAFPRAIHGRFLAPQGAFGSGTREERTKRSHSGIRSYPLQPLSHRQGLGARETRAFAAKGLTGRAYEALFFGHAIYLLPFLTSTSPGSLPIC